MSFSPYSVYYKFCLCTCSKRLEGEVSGLKGEAAERQSAWNVERVEITKEKEMLSQQLNSQQSQVSELKQELSQV